MDRVPALIADHKLDVPASNHLAKQLLFDFEARRCSAS
jgi:hypothetical protein